MHEMALCESIVQILQDESRAQGFSRVKSVWVDIGELAPVDPQALQFGFDVVCRGTLADGAALHLLRSAGSAWCEPCARAVALARREDPCPHCGGHQLRITGGDGMRIKELEVE